MTQEEKRIKLAEAQGWKWMSRENEKTSWLFPKSLRESNGMMGEVYGPLFVEEIPQSRRLGFGVSNPPDYFNDLKACHELERTDGDHPSKIPHPQSMYNRTPGL